MKPTQSRDLWLLTAIGQHFQTAHDAALSNRGPTPQPWASKTYSLAALNPQPLPPLELGAIVAVELVRTMWLADRFGLDWKRFEADLEELCPRPPRPIKWPPWLYPVPEPDPHPNWLREFQLGLAARLAVVSFENAAMSDRIGKVIERSVLAIGSAVAPAPR
ncbi:MAG: hypothetical protein ACREP2_06855 [Rhodanobacteraceae bacterium]